MAQLYLEQLLRGRVAGQVGAGPIVRVLKEESPESVFHILNRLFWQSTIIVIRLRTKLLCELMFRCTLPVPA